MEVMAKIIQRWHIFDGVFQRDAHFHSEYF